MLQVNDKLQRKQKRGKSHFHLKFQVWPSAMMLLEEIVA